MSTTPDGLVRLRVVPKARESTRATPPTPHIQDADMTLYLGDALDVLRALPDGSADCCITSPPYWGLRDYGVAGQLGLEPSPDEYVAAMVAVFREVRRVLTDAGTLWLNLGDTYAGNRSYQVPDNKHRDVGNTRGMTVSRRRDDAPVPRSDVMVAGAKPKDLLGIPWRVALALQADGWYLRSDIIWSKPNPMPESVTDRPTKAHEYVFLLSKQPRYFYDAQAISEPAAWERWGDQTVPKHNGTSTAAGWIKPKTKQDLVGENRPAGRGDTYSGFNARYAAADPASRRERNARSVWTFATQPYPDAHFAVFPEELPRRCILAGCPQGGTVLDPFAGSGTTGLVARRHGRRSILIELNEDYARMAARRLQQLSLLAEGDGE